MSAQKKAPKESMEDVQTALQNLIAQGKKEGVIRANELNALLEKMVLTPEKLEEIYDRFEAMNIQLITNDLDLDVGLEEEDLVDPVTVVLILILVNLLITDYIF